MTAPERPEQTNEARTGASSLGEGRLRVRRIGLVLGPLLAALALLGLPVSEPAGADALALSSVGRATAAVAIWMAVWWLTEAIPVYATALLPLVMLPLLGAASMRSAAAPYAHELIFLFMGGFLIALAMQRWGLHRRIALRVLRSVGDRPGHIVAAFMGVTAMLSMWVSNSASAVMMLPVATSVIDLASPAAPATPGQGPALAARTAHRNFGLAMLLGIAYSASIGGIGTPIGTPPNLFLLSYLKSELGVEVGFVRWMAIGVPLVLVFLPVTWWLLTRVLHPLSEAPIEGGGAVASELEAMGPMGRGERITAVVFALAVLAWLTRPLLVEIELFGVTPLAGLTDAGIAMSAALSLFVAPVSWREARFTLDWETATHLPWGVLILFGGGLSLAVAIRANGVGEALGAQVTAFAGIPSLGIVLVVVAGMIFLTELTSNTATTATLVPVLAAIAPGLGLDPLLLAVPAAIAASCAFMLPVATPPNAVIFGSGRVRIQDMSRAGFWLNWIGVLLVTALAYGVAMPLLR